MSKRLVLLLGVLVLALAGAGLRLVLQPKPGPGHAEYALAQQAADRGDLAQQTESLRRAVSLEPGNGEYHSELGDAFLRTARYEEACAELQAAAFLDPNRPHVYCRLAQALVELRRRSEALEALDLALRKAPDCPHALSVRGEQLLRDDNLKDALPIFQKVIRMQPGFALAYQNAGYILLAINRPDEAIPVLEKGVKIAPDHSGLQALLGEAYSRSPTNPHASELAEQHFRLSLPHNPEAWKAHASLGELYLRRNDLSGARAEFQQALAQRPELANALYGLSRVDSREGHAVKAARELKQYEASQELGRRLAELQSQALARPDDVERQLRLARFAVEHHLPIPASQALENAVQLDPARREVRELRAQLFIALGKGEEGSRELAVAAHLPPGAQ